MTDWYYAVGREQKGPENEEYLRELIRGGHLGRDTYVWREGMDDWQRAGDHPGLARAFPSVPPPLPDAVPASASGPPAAKDRPVAISRPWPRFWARSIDNVMFGALSGVAMFVGAALYAPDFYLWLNAAHTGLIGILAMPVVGLLVALSMTVTGTTPGKAIAGVRVAVPHGRNRIGFFLSRELKVWFAGLGLGIPFAALFTQIYQYRRLTAGKAASYDEGNPAVVANPSRARLVLTAVVASGLFLICTVAGRENDVATSTLSATRTWVNPVTNKTATIGSTWQVEEMTTNSGRAFYFSSDNMLAEAIFGYEQFPSEGLFDELVYANALKEAVSSNVHITSEWKEITVNGLPALRATGSAVGVTDSAVEVTVVVDERDAWRTLVFARGTSESQTAEKERLVRAMFATTN